MSGVRDFLFAFLSSARSSKRFYEIMDELESENYMDCGNSARVTLSRMSKSGYITRSSAGWKLTQKGKSYVLESKLYDYIMSPFKIGSPINTIISFDIPEKDRRIRNWLRTQLKVFGYELLQQSVWKGPGPLPKSFNDRLVELGIKENIKIFNIVTKR